MTTDELFVKIIEEIGAWLMAAHPDLYEPDWVGPRGDTLKLLYKANITRWIVLAEWGEKGKLVVNAPVGYDPYELFGNNYDLADPTFFDTVERDLTRVVKCHVNGTGWGAAG